MACKRPSASVVDDTLDPLVYVTPRTECHCGGSLHPRGQRAQEATLVTLTGCVEIKQIPMECSRRGCRAQFHYNYTKRDGKRINSVSLKDVRALFIHRQLAFDLKFLEYHEALHFRGFLSVRAVSWAFQGVLAGDSHTADDQKWRLRYQDVRVLYVAMKEFGDMREAGFRDYLHSIELSHMSDCKEVTQKMLAEYDAWLHKDVFPPAKPDSVTAMAGDGHEKVLTKVCAGDKMPKKPPQTHHGKPKAFTNGWFMLIKPADGRILSVEQQFEPENNDVPRRC